MISISFVMAATGITLYGGLKTYKQNKKKSNRTLISLLSKGQAAVQTSEKESVRPQFDNSFRHQKPKALSSVKPENTKGWSLENPEHYLAVSSVSLAMSVAAILYHPLYIFGLPGYLYGSFPVYRQSYHELKRGQITISTMISIILGGLVLKGDFALGNFIVFMRFASASLTNKVKQSAQQDMINLLNLQPNFVWLLDNGIERQIRFDELQVGDLVVVHAGEVIPVDGTIVDGIASIDQHILTGESQPSEKEVGGEVFALTFVVSGKLCIKVEKANDETAVAQITQILNNATKTKSTIQLRSEEITDKTVLPTLVAGALSLPFLGFDGGLAVLSSHFKYRMATVAPLSMLNYLNLASKNGILIKEGITLELLRKVDTLVFDKTGTLTEEQPHIGEIHIFDMEMTEDEIITFAAAAEYKQTHPIAKAILEEAEQRQLNVPVVSDSNVKVGYGLRVVVDNQLVRVGSLRFMEMEGITISPVAKEAQESGHRLGHSLVMVTLNEKLIGAIEMHATVRPEARHIIRILREEHNIRSIYIISGDHEAPTKRLAEELGIEHYFAETLPQNKAQIIKQLQEEGKFVCYIGDGINDSIALKESQVSISMRGASTIATDTARIILMDGSLNQLPQLFKISQDFDSNMNVSWGILLLTTAMNITGILFMGFGIVSVVIMNRISLAACLSNVMRPIVEEKIESSIPHKLPSFQQKIQNKLEGRKEPNLA